MLVVVVCYVLQGVWVGWCGLSAVLFNLCGFDGLTFALGGCLLVWVCRFTVGFSCLCCCLFGALLRVLVVWSGLLVGFAYGGGACLINVCTAWFGAGVGLVVG